MMITLMMCLMTMVSFGQNNDTLTIKEPKYVYCELLGTNKLFTNKVTVSIDYGEEKKYFKDTRIKDEQTGKVKTFNSMVDALNYMGEDGWEFVQAYVVTTNQQNVYRWLLRKVIESN
jgi:hypothetical protein